MAEIEGLDEHDHGYPGYMMEDDLSDFAPEPIGTFARPTHQQQEREPALMQ
jgi:hypothetical protein